MWDTAPAQTPGWDRAQVSAALLFRIPAKDLNHPIHRPAVKLEADEAQAQLSRRDLRTVAGADALRGQRLGCNPQLDDAQKFLCLRHAPIAFERHLFDIGRGVQSHTSHRLSFLFLAVSCQCLPLQEKLRTGADSQPIPGSGLTVQQQLDGHKLTLRNAGEAPAPGHPC